VPRVGHVPMWDDSRLVAKTITDWVDAHLVAPVAAADLSLAGESAS